LKWMDQTIRYIKPLLQNVQDVGDLQVAVMRVPVRDVPMLSVMETLPNV
jgi:hypothetical protein